MSTKSQSAGTTLGIIFTIIFIGWFGYQHYLDTQESRLPLKIQQELIKLQKDLPIKLNEYLNLENFKLKRNSVDVVLRATRDLSLQFSREEIENRINLSMCQWRSNYLNNDPVMLKMKIMDLYDNELISIKNTSKTCNNTSQFNEKFI